MSLRVRDDDIPLIEWLRARTGVGALRAVPAQGASRPQVQWLVQTQDECRAVAELLARFPMRGRKRAEFDLWSAAVELWRADVMDRVERVRRLAAALVRMRRFKAGTGEAVPPPGDTRALQAYLHGFLCAEGSFTLDRSHTSLTVHLRRDDRPLLEMFAQSLGVGRLGDHPAYGSSRPSTTWRVARLDEVARLADGSTRKSCEVARRRSSRSGCARSRSAVPRTQAAGALSSTG